MSSRPLGFLALLPALMVLGGSQPGAHPEHFSPDLQWARTAVASWVKAEDGSPLNLPSSLQGAVRMPEGAASGTEPEFHLLVRTDDPAALRDAGFRVGTVAGEVATVVAPLSRLADLEGVSGLRHAELARSLRPLLDVSGPAVGFDLVHGGSPPAYTGFTGAGVVVGVIDTGIDYHHDDFKNEDGTTRISYIWDMTGSGTPPSGYTYGREWSSTQINSGTCTEQDTDGHGTHVTGIAAGNGRSTENPSLKYTFVGGAPEAEIIFVKGRYFTEDEVLDGVNWIQTRAGSKPCVINISLGGNFGPHDGTSTLETGLSSLCGPGRIVASAAGNERGLDIHAEVVLGSVEYKDLTFSVPAYMAQSGPSNDIVDLDGWFPGGSSLTFVVTSPHGYSTSPSTTTNAYQQSATADGTIIVNQGTAGNGDRNVVIRLWDPDGVAPSPGTWTVRVQNVQTTSRELDVWSAGATLGGFALNVPFTNNVDPGEILTTPSTADSLLCVAAYVTKTQWQTYTGSCTYQGNYPLGSIAPFSSAGPRRDGYQKPEISAPGMGIASALSATATNPTFTQACGKTPDGRHTVSQGTSQSSPHVAAAAALLLEADPTLSAKAIRDVLVQNADHDSYTGAGFSTSFGFGKLNVKKSIDSVVPVLLLSFTAAWEDGNATVRWELSETEPGARFTVERGPARDGDFHAVSGSLTGDLSFAWTDPDPLADEPWYRLSISTRDGGRKVFAATRLDPLVGELRLWQNAPNPFASSTVIAFELDHRREVTVDVLDVAGRRVKTLVSGVQPAGRNEVTWDGHDAGGRVTAAGMYFYRLSTSDKVLAGRMIRTR